MWNTTIDAPLGYTKFKWANGVYNYSRPLDSLGNPVTSLTGFKYDWGIQAKVRLAGNYTNGKPFDHTWTADKIYTSTQLSLQATGQAVSTENYYWLKGRDGGWAAAGSWIEVQIPVRIQWFAGITYVTECEYTITQRYRLGVPLIISAASWMASNMIPNNMASWTPGVPAGTTFCGTTALHTIHCS